MHVNSVTLSGFQCFGPDPTTVSLETGVTSLIGANSSGKTAFLEGLLRLFGASQSQRRIRRGDFYMPPGADLEDEDVTRRDLWIEARIEAPELLAEENPAVAPFFQKVQIIGDGSPYIRARLEATWREDVTPEGSIEEDLMWVLEDGEPRDEVPEEETEPMGAYERGKILVEYIPAQRDAIEEVQHKTGSVVSRLLQAVNWSEEVKSRVEDAAQEIREAAADEEAIGIVNDNLDGQWGELHRGPYDSSPTLHVVKQQFRELIRSVDVSFQPAEVESEHSVEDLSDGLQSLFHLSLLLSYYRIQIEIEQNGSSTTGGGNSASETKSDTGDAEPVQEVAPPTATPESNVTSEVEAQDEKNEEAVDDSQPEEAFIRSKIDTPSLVVLALEEPENHLSPYYLSRIITQIRRLVDSDRVQALLTSHSASTLSRIEPEEIRHLRLEPENRTSQVASIQLPTETDESYKYVRQAVNAFPELYFAKFVVFGEGDSEEIVLPHLARALGIEFDPSFVAMVPLGGRYVNHFWRLVTRLGIPHATLLDLDVGREGAGWRRIQYVLRKLLEVGKEQDEVLNVENGPTLSLEDLETLAEDKDLGEKDEMQEWIEHLQSFGVFFSQPLDLDWSMLDSFETAYHGAAPNEPQGEVNQEEVNSAINTVLNKNNVYDEAADAGFYADEDDERFLWYRYLFGSRSKPSSHLGALSSISPDDENTVERMPDSLEALLSYAEHQIKEFM